MADQTAICFSTDSFGADKSTDGSTLTVKLDPPLTIQRAEAGKLFLSSFRFINAVRNISAAIGNNRVYARWRTSNGMANPLTHYAASIVLRDGTYTLQQLQDEINTKLNAEANWPDVNYDGYPGSGQTTSGRATPITLSADTVTNRVNVTLDPMWGDASTNGWVLELWDDFTPTPQSDLHSSACGVMILARDATTYTLIERVYESDGGYVTTTAGITIPAGYWTYEQFVGHWNAGLAFVSGGLAWRQDTKDGFALQSPAVINTRHVSSGGRGILHFPMQGHALTADGKGYASRVFLDQALLAANAGKVERFIASTGGVPFDTQALGLSNNDIDLVLVSVANTVQLPLLLLHPDEPHCWGMLGFGIDQQPISSRFISQTIADSNHAQSQTVQGNHRARLDRSNCLRIDCDAATGMYAPPRRHSDGQSKGREDSLAFIPITAGTGEQQVFQPPNPLRVTIPGQTSLRELRITIRDQSGRTVPMDEPFSGVVVVEHLHPAVTSLTSR